MTSTTPPLRTSSHSSRWHNAHHSVIRSSLSLPFLGTARKVHAFEYHMPELVTARKGHALEYHTPKLAQASGRGYLNSTYIKKRARIGSIRSTQTCKRSWEKNWTTNSGVQGNALSLSNSSIRRSDKQPLLCIAFFHLDPLLFVIR